MSLWETQLRLPAAVPLLWGFAPLLRLYHSHVPLTLLEVDTEQDLSTYLASEELFHESTSATEYGGHLCCWTWPGPVSLGARTALT